VLVDALGRPRYWTSYSLARNASSWADSTKFEYLCAIERFYLFVEAQTGSDCLDELIASVDIDRLEGSLDGYFAQLRNEQSRTGRSQSGAWSVATRFIRACLDDLVHYTSTGERRRTLLQSLDRFASMGDRLNIGRRRRHKIRALPAAVVEDLYELAWPNSSRNPFRRRTGKDRFWLNVSENPNERTDPRPDRPWLRNQLATRQIPISRAIVDAIDAQGWLLRELEVR